ncbi:MAG TPA: phosphomannomutase/phosphoglucomutase [Candidatus Nitrosocosmicus sp.]|nr:phosphomannomutase/phosphoglucomutase [Candidatus Nitrosocosmicus sp.]
MTTINPGIFKSYDIRGIYPEEINEENIYAITQAVYKVLQDGRNTNEPLKLVIGKDMRLSAPKLYPIFIQALIDTGAELHDIDMVSTPTLYFAVSHYNYDGGIQLTASHNPSNYTGMKMVINTPNGLIKIGKSTGMEEVKRYALENLVINSETKGSITKKDGVLEDEVQNAIKIAKGTDVKPLKIVADPGNAMGAQYLDALFQKLPCTLIRMNFELDGSFPVHQPDPMQPQNLADLKKRVIEENADLGLAPDGDGDRLFVIDEKGEIVPASIITALVARELLKDNPGATILYDIRYTNTAKKIIEEFGGKSDITKVGHAFITEKMTQTGAIFGGESSGHYFFKETGNAEAQMPMILMILNVLSRESKPISEVAKELRRSFESGEINFVTSNSEQILDLLKQTYNDGTLVTIDGTSVNFPDWRFGVRSSNTEPLLRLNVEADTEELMKQKRDELILFLQNEGAKLVEGH